MDEAPIAPMGNLCHCLTAFQVKNRLLLPDLNPIYFKITPPGPVAISPCTKCLPLMFISSFQVVEGCSGASWEPLVSGLHKGKSCCLAAHRKRLQDQNGYFWAPRAAVRPRGKALPTKSSVPFGSVPRTAQQRGFAPLPLQGAPRGTKGTLNRGQSSDGTTGWDAGTHRSSEGRRAAGNSRPRAGTSPQSRRGTCPETCPSTRSERPAGTAAACALTPPHSLCRPGPPHADVSLLSPDTARGRAQRRAFALPLSAWRPGAEGGPPRSAHPASRRARPRSICLQPITSPPRLQAPPSIRRHDGAIVRLAAPRPRRCDVASGRP